MELEAGRMSMVGRRWIRFLSRQAMWGMYYEWNSGMEYGIAALGWKIDTVVGVQGVHDPLS